MGEIALKEVMKNDNKTAAQLLAAVVGIHRSTVLRERKHGAVRKVRRDKLPENTGVNITTFYKKEDISRQKPHKRYANKFGPGFLMQCSISAAYKIFRKENPNVKVGIT